jgi:hypothetical protein
MSDGPWYWMQGIFNCMTTILMLLRQVFGAAIQMWILSLSGFKWIQSQRSVASHIIHCYKSTKEVIWVSGMSSNSGHENH